MSIEKKLHNDDSGQAMILAVVLIMGISFGLVTRGVLPVTEDNSLVRSNLTSKIAQISAEAGAEDVSYRIRSAMLFDSVESLTLNSIAVSTTVVDDLLTSAKIVLAGATVQGATRRSEISLVKGVQEAFNYAVQLGKGGMTFANSSSVVGNIYSDGPVVGVGNSVSGSVVSSGPAGRISSLNIGGDAYAHTINTSTVTGAGYYTSTSGSTFGGGGYPASPDQATQVYPISTSTIAAWEASALASGNISSSPCPYVISGNATIGPAVYNCGLTIGGSGIVYLAGPVWVKGNFIKSGSGSVRISPSLGKGVAIIADNPADHFSSSIITVSNSSSFPTFVGLDSPLSYILLISMASTTLPSPGGFGGSPSPAISLTNSVNGDVILYAPNGEVSIANSANVTTVTAYKLSIRNSAQLIYEDGLASSIFDTGPAGSWDLNSWKEAQ